MIPQVFPISNFERRTFSKQKSLSLKNQTHYYAAPVKKKLHCISSLFYCPNVTGLSNDLKPFLANDLTLTYLSLQVAFLAISGKTM